MFRKKAESLRNLPRSIRERNRLGISVGFSVVSLLVPPVGPGIAGGIGVFNSGYELNDVRRGKPRASIVRTGVYAALAASEFYLQFQGNQVYSWENDILNHFGHHMPGFMDYVARYVPGGGIGLITGLGTNTTNWELIRAWRQRRSNLREARLQ